MKCPKCGYVGFEEMARCRHCGYDFTFAAAAAVPVAPADAHRPLSDYVDEVLGARRQMTPPTDRLGFLDLPALDAEIETPVAPPRPSLQELFADPAPPPARPPLAVRRGPDRPRSRPASHVVRRSAGGLLDAPLSADPPAGTPSQAVIGPGSLLARTAAGIIDVALLGGIVAAVVYLTVRLSGLTMAQVGILPVVPLSAFLLGLVLSYLVAFTCCGGQTLGKMAFGLRVVADDGAVPPGTAVLRALVTVAGVAMAGLGVLPAIFDGERRAVHDRVAGTRVVRT